MGERRTLGRFVVGEPVATGPLGVLHRARVYGDAGFEKDFALLVVDAAVARDAAALGRFVRAANAWARLGHPRIAHAHELGAEGDSYFLVSDWTRAATVGALVADGPLPLDAALTLVADAAEAVQHAHARSDLVPGGILHLGLSPETLLVDARGDVLVRDFGLLTARVAPGWAGDDALVYALRYAAPELHADGVVDGRADVFSLGAVLFELVTGRPAFGGARAADVTAQMELSPPSLSGVPPAAGPLVARMLAARAAARLPSLAELRAQALALVGERADAARALLAERARRRLPAEVPRPSPLDAPADPPSQPRGPSLADDFFAALPAGEPAPLPALPLGKFPSLAEPLPRWNGKPLLPPPKTPVWDPPSTTATTTLEALRRRRARPWLRALVPLALVAAVGGGVVVWHRVQETRQRLLAAERAALARATVARLTTRVESTPPGAQLFVDGDARGLTPATVALDPGTHRVVLALEGYQLWRGAVSAGATLATTLQPARLPDDLVGEAGLKVVCRLPGQWRVFVDGVDTGRTCPVDERIPITPGRHHLTLYAPFGDRTVEVARAANVLDRGASTRIFLDE